MDAVLSSDQTGVEMPDYIYRMRLRPRPSCLPNEKRLLELVRTELRDLLDIVVLYSNGTPVEIDAFAFVNDETNIQWLYREVP